MSFSCTVCPTSTVHWPNWVIWTNWAIGPFGALDHLGHCTIVALVVIVPFGPVNFSDHWPIWDIGSTEPIEVGQTIQNRKKICFVF